MKKPLDYWILLSLIGLSFFSLFNIFGIKHELFGNQLFFFIVGFILLYTFYRIGILFFRLNSTFFYISFLILLIVTFFIGTTVRGSRRWIDLYFFRFQTSEFFKVFFLLYLADYISKVKKIDKRTYLISFFIFLAPFLIIFKQPDLASSLVYLFVFVCVLFLTGFPLKYFAYGIGSIVVSLPVLWHFLKDYQKVRFISFINPEPNSQGIAYNLIQSIITVGSGRFFGRGLGLGTQSRFQFLPEYHTDFAFASLVEQFGLFGGVIVLALYGIIIYRLFKKARIERNNPFAFLYLYGSALFLTISLAINIGMNVGLLPIAGIALPLISYGGSSILSIFIMLGLALSL